MALRRRRRRDMDRTASADADAAPVPTQLRPLVDDAVRSQRRFHAVVAGLHTGPLRDRLDSIGARVDATVIGIRALAEQAHRIEQVLDQLDPDRVAADLKAARRRRAEQSASDENDPVLDALTARFESTQRLLNALDEIGTGLRTLDARLGAAVARAAEIQLLGSGDDAVDALGAQLDDVVIELTALRSGIAAVG